MNDGEREREVQWWHGQIVGTRLGWHLVNMKNDWKVMFPFELK